MTTENKSQLDFLEEYTRTKLVDWCAVEVLGGEPVNFEALPSKLVQLALEKAWISKRTPHTITAKGYYVAAAFLRR